MLTFIPNKRLQKYSRKLDLKLGGKTDIHNLFYSRLIRSVLSVTSVIRVSYHDLLSLLVESFTFRRVSS